MTKSQYTLHYDTFLFILCTNLVRGCTFHNNFKNPFKISPKYFNRCQFYNRIQTSNMVFVKLGSI